MQLNATMLRSSARALVCEHSEPRVTADTVIAVSQRRVRDEGKKARTRVDRGGAYTTAKAGQR